MDSEETKEKILLTADWNDIPNESYIIPILMFIVMSFIIIFSEVY